MKDDSNTPSEGMCPRITMPTQDEAEKKSSNGDSGVKGISYRKASKDDLEVPRSDRKSCKKTQVNNRINCRYVLLSLISEN